MKLDYDFDTDEYEITDIKLFDRGFDFYAPQSFEDESGRRILIGWMGIPDADYTNPTEEAGWQHALTIPRELSVRDGKLIQEPIEELKQLRSEDKAVCTFCYGQTIIMQNAIYEAIVDFKRCREMVMTLREGITLSYKDNILTLNLGVYGSGRSTRKVRLEKLEHLQIFADTSSLEIFVNHGEEVFTTRIYNHYGRLLINGECSGIMTDISIKSLKSKEEDMKNKLCGIGEALIDFIPEVKGQRLKDVPSFKRVAGGAPANVVGAVTKLGIPSKFLTKLGDDPFGDYIVEVLDEAGIDTSNIARDKEGETSLSICIPCL